MQFLRLMGVSSDASSLILVGDGGAQFRLPVDEPLRTAVRASRVLPASHATTLGLPPREIQARLRSGASADEVAQAAGIPVEKVRRYEVPILAERAHIAALAGQAMLRRPTGTTAAGPAARTLTEVVAARADAEGFATESVGWDAWRGEDGRWIVSVNLPTTASPSHWSFEPSSRAVAPRDDNARELLVDRLPVESATASVHSFAARSLAAQSAHATQSETVEAEPASKVRRTRIELPEQEAVGDSRRQSRRPSVPAWDDILLGARRSD